MSQPEHPGPDVLLRFLRGEAAGAERSAVVRHLLAGCPECAAVTQPAWRLAEHGLRALPTYRRKANSLGIYHELLADNWEALSPVNRWRYLEKFLSRRRPR